MAAKLSVWIQTLLFGAIMAFVARIAATQDIAFQPCNTTNYLSAFHGNCFKFLTCSPSGYYVMDCPANLVFSEPYQRCDYRYLVPGCENATRGPSPCEPNQCVRGTCVVDSTRTQRYRCDCLPGYTGFDCTLDIDECSNSPCVRGVCKNIIGSFSCDCGNTGYSGQYCEQIPNNPICVNGSKCEHGACQPTLTGNFCSCEPGYKGLLCNEVADACSPSPCLNNGTCSLNSNNVSTCTCPQGYTGVRCEQDVNECLMNPSLCVGGTCINNLGGYTCNCPGNYTGQSCYYDLCTPISCLNGGTCYSDLYETYCVCPERFSGGICETYAPNPSCTNVYPCPSDVPSYNYPAWSDNSCRSYYSCNRGSLTLWSCPVGQKFDVVTMSCKSETDSNRFFCDIFRGRDYCNPSPCVHGSCVNTGSAAVCSCEPGYMGATCNTTTFVTSSPDCPKYPCPTDVPLYVYPSWSDASCRSYYKCAYGSLDPLACPVGEKFDVVTMSCKSEMDTTRFFCDAFKM